MTLVPFQEVEDDDEGEEEERILTPRLDAVRASLHPEEEELQQFCGLIRSSLRRFPRQRWSRVQAAVYLYLNQLHDLENEGRLGDLLEQLEPPVVGGSKPTKPRTESTAPSKP